LHAQIAETLKEAKALLKALDAVVDCALALTTP
jgi:hypothetical protein